MYKQDFFFNRLIVRWPASCVSSFAELMKLNAIYSFLLKIFYYTSFTNLDSVSVLIKLLGQNFSRPWLPLHLVQGTACA
jgi:hypothetical protein